VTDHQLIQACKKDSRAAQEQLYRQYSGQMYSICLRYCKDGSSAAEALQVGFIKVFRSITNYQGAGSLGAWIRKIIVNACLDQIKLDKRHFSDEIDSAAFAEYSYELEHEFDDFNYQQLLRLLDQLPMGYRVVFTMNVLDEMSHAEIAAALNISVSTSRTQLLKARKAMQSLIKTDSHLALIQKSR